MKFQNNKKIIKAICLFFVCSNCEIKNKNYLPDKSIIIDSLKLIDNFTYKRNDNLISKIDISSVLRNVSNDTLIIYTYEDKKSICDVKKSMQIGNKTITIQSSKCEINSPRPVVIAPREKQMYNIEYFDPIYVRLGLSLYIEYEISLCYNKSDTLYSNDSTTMKILPYTFSQELRDKNTFTVHLDLLKNTVRLVDSTFDEVLKSYKRRGYIEQ